VGLSSKFRSVVNETQSAGGGTKILVKKVGGVGE